MGRSVRVREQVELLSAKKTQLNSGKEKGKWVGCCHAQL